MRCSYLSLRLILVNSTRPASIGSVRSPAEIIRRQSSYVWSVTGTPKALKADSLIRGQLKCLWGVGGSRRERYSRMWEIRAKQKPNSTHTNLLFINLCTLYMFSTLFITCRNIYSRFSMELCSAVHSRDTEECAIQSKESVLYSAIQQHKVLSTRHNRHKTNEHSLGHSLSHSTGKQSRAFLLLFCGDVRRQELENRTNRVERSQGRSSRK